MLAVRLANAVRILGNSQPKKTCVMKAEYHSYQVGLIEILILISERRKM